MGKRKGMRVSKGSEKERSRVRKGRKEWCLPLNIIDWGSGGSNKTR
jgi:hypothetical protein